MLRNALDVVLYEYVLERTIYLLCRSSQLGREDNAVTGFFEDGELLLYARIGEFLSAKNKPSKVNSL